MYDNFSDWIDAIHPEDRQRFCEAFLSKASSGRFDETYRIIRSDGLVRWIHDRGFPIEDHASRVSRIAGIAEDITEVRSRQERLTALAQQAAVQEMTKGLAHEMGLALRRSQASLDRLGFSLEGHPEAIKVAPDARDLIAEIQLAQDHLQRTHLEVREYAAPLKLMRRAYDLAALLGRTWIELTVHRKNGEAQLRQLKSASDLRCDVDRYALSKVFHNVLLNSLHACSGRVEIDVYMVGWRDSGAPSYPRFLP